MKKNVRSTFAVWGIVAVATFSARLRVEAADGDWTGAAGAIWASDANWNASPYPSGPDTATFSGAGNGNTVIDLIGLPGIAFITFSSSGVAAYTLGAGGVDSQTLVMAAGGLFQISADAGNSQTVNAAVRLGPDAAAGVYAFKNDSATRTLTFAGSVSGGEGGTPEAKTLTVSGAGDTVLVGAVSDGGASAVALVVSAEGAVTLSGANSHSGGTAVESGTLTASHAQALGTGPVANDGTLNLTVSSSTYTGLSSGLSGTGTVNVALSTGTAQNILDGDTSGFTGTWNLGVPARAGRARMNGADNAAATVHVLSNASLYVDGPVVKRATAILYGGNICDQLGQLRLENGAEWAGPVVFAGDITDSADGLIGNDNNGYGIVSGPISDINGPHVFEKRLAGTLALTATNSTYAGLTWCRGGSLVVPSIKNMGEPSSLGAPLTPENNVLKLGSSNTSASLVYTGTGDTTDRVIDMAGTTGGATIEQAGSGVFTLNGGIISSGIGNKTLTLSGSTDGIGELPLAYTNSPGGTYTLAKSGTGTWVLSGINTHSGETQINNGTLRLTHPTALSGTGVARFYNRWPGDAALELAHDGEGETPFNVMVAVGYCGTLLSGVATGDTGINHSIGMLSMSLSTVNVARAANVLNGAPSITVQTVNLSGGGAHTSTLNPTTADLVVGDVTQLSSPFRKTLNVGGTAVGNRITGVIDNGVHTVSVAKTDTGTWALTGANTYTGTTSVANGTLALAGVNGAVTASDSVTLSGGTLLLDNTEDVNTDRLGDTKPVTLAGGTLAFRHTGGAADYSETAGALNVVSGNGRITVSQTDVGQTSTLTFSSLSRTGGQIDFSGAGLGQDGRNEIRFTAEPTLENGVIGLWATVNGTALATYGANGITAYTGYTDISAKGPSVIPDDATAHVRIDSEGSEGGITLEEEDTRVMTLTQNSAFNATVTTAGKTFRTSALFVSEDAAALTIGGAVDDGAVSALSAGGDLLLANLSGQPLTIHAATVDNGTASSLTKNTSGPVVLKGAVLHTGVTTIENGELTFGGHEVPQTVSSVISGSGTLVKSGTNQLHLFVSSTFTGPTYINEGIVRPNSNTTFGTSAGGVYIADGATLDVGCTPDVGGTRGRDSLNLGTERFYVCGAGVDGKGAIVNNSTGYQYSVFGRITLTGDTTFGGLTGWRIRNNTPSLTLDGYTLRKVGPSVVDLYDTTVNPGAGHIDIVEGSLRVMYNARMNGGETNTVTIRSGATLEQQYNYPQHVQMWKLLCEDGAILRVGQGMATSNQWGGPIVLNGALNLNAGSSYRQTLSGQISGTGSLVKNNSSWVNLTGTNNTYDGITRITNGRLVISSLRNVGEASSLGQPSTDENGAVVIGSGTTSGIALDYAGEGDTTDRVIRMGGTTGGLNLYQNGTGLWKLTRDMEMEVAGSKGIAFRGDGPAAGEFSGRIANVGGSTVNVAKYDSGTWILSGDNTYSSSTTSYGTGALYITGSNTCSGSITAYGGLIAYTGSNTCSGTVNVFGGTVQIAGTNAFTGAQYVNGKGALVYAGANAQGSSGIYVGNSTASNGVMRLLPGANVTGTGAVRVGGGTGSAGALYVTGGRLARTPAGDSDDTFALGRGQNSYGHLNISGGEVSHIRLQVGGVSTSTAQGMGVVRMTGGTLSFHKWLLLGRNVGSVGILTLDGGELQHLVDGDKRNLALCYEGGRAEVNLTGGLINSPGSLLSVRQNHSSYPATGIVNICAGTLAVDSITNRGATAYVNFAGGTLKACVNDPRFLPAQLTGVYLYGPFGAFAGGAVIDTDGNNVTAVAPLLAPSGSGVYAVTLSDMGSGYLGEPIITLTGDGISATAVANMEDDGTGNGTYRVASVTITCPGSGYTVPPEVSFSGGGNGAVAPTVDAVTLAPNASGGLTKTGAGTLTLSGANTYGGTTTVAGGTLKLANAQALPTQTAVVIDGGTLDLNGYTVTNSLTALSGSVVNGTVETVLSPGGAGVVGTNTVVLSGAALTGTYLADVRAGGACDRVIVEGDLNLGGLTLTLVDPGQLDISREYTLLSCTGTLSGTLACGNLPAGRWRVVTRPDKTAVLLFTRGTLMRIH